MKRIEVLDMGLMEYGKALELQESLFGDLLDKKQKGETTSGKLILCQHPHVYTIGRSGDRGNMLIGEESLRRMGAKLVEVGRGGDITYHGPGQLVGYPIIDLEAFGLGMKEYIHTIEETVIRTLDHWNIGAARLEGATGVWLGGRRKICAIGVKASRYVTMHGFALNVTADLSYFDHINPCGFTDKGVTSMEKETGEHIPVREVGRVLADLFMECFGRRGLVRQNDKRDRETGR